MRKVPLTQAKAALVDDEDYERVVAVKWYAHFERGYWYARRKTAGKTQYMHSFILDTGQEIDHKNGDGLDNQRFNLRVATRGQNLANQRKRTNASSKYKGVCRHGNKWQAYCRGKHIGLFDTEEEAALAYDTRAYLEFGEFSLRNFPDLPIVVGGGDPL